MLADHWNGDIDGDWIYIYFLVPSCLSFIASSFLLVVLKMSEYYRIPFYQYAAIHAVLDLLHNASWFPGPRYHTSGAQCKVQEYVFQFSSLCKFINTTLVVGSAYMLLKTKVFNSGWTRLTFILSYLGAVSCLILSAIFDTAALFCPFEHDNMYVVALSKSDMNKERIVYFVAFIGPIVILLAFISYFFIKIIVLSRKSYPEHVRKKYVIIDFFATNLIYGLILVYMFFSPMFVYLSILAIFGRSITVLAKTGATSASSAGFIMCIVFFICVKKCHRLYNIETNIEDSRFETLSPTGETIYNYNTTTDPSNGGSRSTLARMTFFSDDTTGPDEKIVLLPEVEFKRGTAL
jgi:hypothetical protein